MSAKRRPQCPPAMVKAVGIRLCKEATLEEKPVACHTTGDTTMQGGYA